MMIIFLLSYKVLVFFMHIYKYVYTCSAYWITLSDTETSTVIA